MSSIVGIYCRFSAFLLLNRLSIFRLFFDSVQLNVILFLSLKNVNFSIKSPNYFSLSALSSFEYATISVMGNKQTKAPRRRLKLFLLVLFLFAVAGGFLGGLYFAEHAPEKASQITQTASETGNTVAARIRRWLDTTSFRGWFDNLPKLPGTSTQNSNGAIQVFFVPASTAGVSPAEDALVALIDSAQKSIACAFYEFELERIARALIARHKAGVTVALVSDSDYSSEAGIILCRDAGIHVIFDKRSALMHNKFCVVDGKYVWTGSTNITRNGMYENNNNAVLITSSELATNFTSEFEEMFVQHKFGATSPRNTAWPTLTVAGTSLECYFAPEDGVEEKVVAKIAEARQQIAFLAFVFTSGPIAEMMGERLTAGAKVRGVIEKRSAGSNYSRHKSLNELGAEIYIDGNPNTMHHKVIVVDGQLVMTGSYNFSASAEEKNDENLIMIHSPEIATMFLEEIDRVIAAGSRVN